MLGIEELADTNDVATVEDVLEYFPIMHFFKDTGKPTFVILEYPDMNIAIERAWPFPKAAIGEMVYEIHKQLMTKH